MKKEVATLLAAQVALIKPSKEVLEKINRVYSDFSRDLEREIAKKKIDAQVFLGGSLAKGSLVKQAVYDIDVFVRFNRKYTDAKISELLGKLLGASAKRVHGSRDYYQITQKTFLLEVIPVLAIDRPSEAENVTDLSFFHVRYLARKMKDNSSLAQEIMLAKSFTHAQGVYGAESYINGFSGYALELLLVYYKTFWHFVEEIARFDFTKKKLIIDIEQDYKTDASVLSEMNPSKTIGPIVLVDPTYKERNAVSGLSLETLTRFAKVCKAFIAKPSIDFFEVQDVALDFKASDIVLLVHSDKQAGDIAGTKSKKFFRFFLRKLAREFVVKKNGFSYDEEANEGRFYIRVGKKKDEVITGPPVSNLRHASAFKKVHPLALIKKGVWHATIKHMLSFEQWFLEFVKKDAKIIREMGIKKITRVKK